MKKFLLAFAIVGLFAGCESMNVNNTTKELGTAAISNIIGQQTFNLKGPTGYLGKIDTTNNWENAVFVDKHGKEFNLERMVSGDGIKIGNKNLNIHFKGTQGILEENGQEYKFNLFN